MKRTDRPAAAIALSAAIALAGCASGDCTATQVEAMLPMTRAGGHYVIPVTMNGTAVRMVLDTGGFTSFLSDRTAVEVGANRLGGSGIGGIGGDGTAEVVNVDHVRFANRLGSQMLFRLLESRSTPVDGASGILGNDLLYSWDVDIDEADGTLGLETPQRCARPSVPWDGGLTTTVPLLSSNTDLVVFDAALAGRKTVAMLDTGAPVSIVDPVAADIDPAILARDPEVTMTGILGRPQTGRRHRFADLTIAGRSFGPIDAIVSPLDIGNVRMVIGNDVIRHYRIDVQYHARQMLVSDELE